VASRVLGGLGALAITIASLSLVASADAPIDTLRGSLSRTAAARTARLEVRQVARAGSATVASTAQATLAGADEDVAVQSASASGRHVAVGAAVYERAPDQPGQPWRQSRRTVPSRANAFGPLTLPNGASISDAGLYQSVTDAGVEALPPGPARKLVASLDMRAVAAAMRLSSADGARVASMSAALTVWVSESDGTVLRAKLSLTAPGDSAAALDTTVDLSDVDGPLVVAAPQQ
jgi:hypothetical protein